MSNLKLLIQFLCDNPVAALLRVRQASQLSCLVSTENQKLQDTCPICFLAVPVLSVLF